MSLLALLIPAGAAVVKIALRLSDPTAPNVADTIDDFSGLYARVTDEVQRRRLTRQAQDLVDEVARRLARELEAEYHSIDDRDLIPAISEVVMAANAVFPLTSQDRVDIVSHENPPAALFKLIESRSHIRDWERQHGDRVSGLAKAILLDVCHNAAAIIRKHPDLSIDMLASLAQKAEDLARLVDDVRDSLSSIPQRVGGISVDSARARVTAEMEEFTVEYLRSVASRFDQLQLYGLDLGLATIPYSLTTSYVPLRLADDASPAHHAHLGRALGSHAFVYLRGPAGSGKTTVLQWLAVGMCRRTLPIGYGRIATRVPLVVRLRNHADGPLPRLTELPRLTAPNTSIEEPAGWLRHTSGSEGFVLLIDGVDEFPEERTSELLTWLHELTQGLKLAAVVIAGRPSAQSVPRAVDKRYRAATLDIQPMNREQIRSFVIHWHISVAGRKRPVADALRAADLLCGAREYRTLASTPLLCAAMCSLFYAKNGNLPSSRIAIYETLVRLLLVQRDAERGIRLDRIDLDGDQMRFVLEQFAMFMLSNNLTEIDLERAVPVVERALLSVPVPVDAMHLLRALLRRSGIIREPAEGKVDFVHRAFLEFLAARAHVDLDSVEALAGRADDQNYADATILAGGLANTSQFRAMVNLVVKRGNAHDDVRPPAWLARLAAGLLTVRRTRVDATETMLLQILHRSLPPDSDEMVRAVASAGESLFEPLVEAVVGSFRASLTPALPGALIRALGEHGGDRALAALKQIPGDIRLAFLDDLLAVWTWFDPLNFAIELLQDLVPDTRTVARLSTSRVFPLLELLHPNFIWIATLPYPEASLAADCVGAPLDTLEINHLDVLDDEDARQCTFVATLSGPRQITLRNATGFAASRLGQDSARVEELKVELTGGEFSLSALDQASGLRRLEISGASLKRLPGSGSFSWGPSQEQFTLTLRDGVEVDPGVSLHAPVVALRNVGQDALLAVCTPALQSLAVHHHAETLDLEPLAAATRLKAASIQNCSDVAHMSAMASLRGLEVLEIRGDCHIDDSQALVEISESATELVVDQSFLEKLGDLAAGRVLSEYEDYWEYADSPERFEPTQGSTDAFDQLLEHEPGEADFETDIWAGRDSEPSDDDLRQIEGHRG